MLENENASQSAFYIITSDNSHFPFMVISIVLSFEALLLFFYKGLKEPTLRKLPSARFKTFVNDQSMTKLTLLGVGKGYRMVFKKFTRSIVTYWCC